MGTKLGDAGRARELARLFEAFIRAFDAQDYEAMQRVRRVIDAIVSGNLPHPADIAAVRKHF